MEEFKKYNIALFSIHGLIRGQNMELGKDADTGGQIKYVVELANALSEHEKVGRVELFTRLVDDAKVSDDYKQAEEELNEKAKIIRLPCGPKRYLRKEVLWPHLDQFVDEALYYFKKQGRTPDIIHGHYADAGYVSARISSILDVPMIQTGHSLGRVKLQRLLDQGMKRENIERQYNIRRRIEAEEISLDYALRVIASTNQEIQEQYEIYDNYEPHRMKIIPPGVDLKNFYPGGRTFHSIALKNKVDCFLEEPHKPMILALSRPDPRKNIQSLIHAYGQNESLQKMANLVIAAGTRDIIDSMDKTSREVLTEILLLIDKYNLYGKAAYPKSLTQKEICDIYRLAKKRNGVFINPALTEPFGLTLIEAAATGLPIVATEDGGPIDIISHCKNGLLIDPLNIHEMSQKLIEALSNKKQWKSWSKSGINGAHKHFSWQSHANKYIKLVEEIYKPKKQKKAAQQPRHLVTSDKFLITAIDDTLLGDRQAVRKLVELIKENNTHLGFGIATGRTLESAVKILKDWKIPFPDVIISSVGSEIHYGPRIAEDSGWKKHINYRWDVEKIKKVLSSLKGLELQAEENQRIHKISYYIDPDIAPKIRGIKSLLRQNGQHVNVVFSHRQYLDILPLRSSKGYAVRYFAHKWGIPFENILVAGDSANDAEMLRGKTLAVVVGNYSEELEKLRKDDPYIHFANGRYASGILEGIEHYNFLNEIQVPPIES